MTSLAAVAMSAFYSHPQDLFGCFLLLSALAFSAGAHLARTPAPMRQKDLAASLVLDGSTVVRLLDALEASGLIERREESTDRRAKVITITSGGRSIIDQVEIASREVRDTALLGLGEADLESAARALALIQTNLEATQERASDEPFTRAPRQRG